MELIPNNMATPNAAQVCAPACSRSSTEPRLSDRIWLEVGHACEPRRGPPGRAAALDWRVWVRGVAGADIAPLVRKVVFQLRPENLFPYPERVFEEPPYQVQKCGAAPTEIIISVFLKCTTKPERIRLQYGPLFRNAERSNADSRVIFYDVVNPSEEWQMALMKAQSSKARDSILVVLPDSGEVRPPLQMLQTTIKPSTLSNSSAEQNTACRIKYEFVELIDPQLWENMTPPKDSSKQTKRKTDDDKLTKPINRTSQKKVKLQSPAPLNGTVPVSNVSSLSQQSTTEIDSHEFVAPIDPSLWENMTLPASKSNGRSKSSPSSSYIPVIKTCLQLPHRITERDDSSSALKTMLRQESTLKLTEDEVEHLWLQCSAHSRYEKSDEALQLPPLPPLRRAPALPASLRRALAEANEGTDFVLQ